MSSRRGEPEFSDAVLSGIIEALSYLRYHLGLYDVEPDFLVRCYEYLLRKFAEGQGQSAGDFYSPTKVGWLRLICFDLYAVMSDFSRLCPIASAYLKDSNN